MLEHCVIATQRTLPVGKVLRTCQSGVAHSLDERTPARLRDKVRRCLAWANDRPRIAGLTIDEMAAIQLYTQQSCLYPNLNAALRDHAQPEKLHPFLPYLRLLLNGLHKLPLVNMRVYRGVKLDLHERYQQLKDEVFTWWAFSSTTRHKENAEQFAGSKDSDGHGTLFIIDAIGVDIAEFSAFPDEGELMLLPGTSIKMKKETLESKFWKFWVSVEEARLPCTDFRHPGWEEYFPSDSASCETPRGENEASCETPRGENEASCETPRGENEAPCETPRGENEAPCEIPRGENEAPCETPRGENEASCEEDDSDDYFF